MKISKQEPAERFTVSISVAEVMILAKYHQREAKSIVKRYREAALLLMTGRAVKLTSLKALDLASQAQISAHIDRSRQLLSKDFVKKIVSEKKPRS